MKVKSLITSGLALAATLLVSAQSKADTIKGAVTTVNSVDKSETSTVYNLDGTMNTTTKADFTSTMKAGAVEVESTRNLQQVKLTVEENAGGAVYTVDVTAEEGKQLPMPVEMPTNPEVKPETTKK
jgi:hypothetical protein